MTMAMSTMTTPGALLIPQRATARTFAGTQVSVLRDGRRLKTRCTAVSVPFSPMRRGFSCALTKQTNTGTTTAGRRRGALTLAAAAATWAAAAAATEDDDDDDANVDASAGAGATDDFDNYPDYNESMEDFAFGAVARIYGDSGLKALRSARVAVVGLGGVGSYAVEVGRGEANVDAEHPESNLKNQRRPFTPFTIVVEQKCY